MANYIGIKLPSMLQLSSSDVITTDSNDDYIGTNLKLLLLTAKGELFGDPSYGTHIKKYLFDINNSATQDLIKEEIISAVTLYMPMISIARTDVTFIVDGTKLSINLGITKNSNVYTDLLLEIE